MKNLIIEYSDTFYLRFRLRPNAFVPRWVKRVQTAQEKYNIDDPTRFYGFGTIQEQTDQSLQLINKCIETINHWQTLIPKQLTDVKDQDYLNFLHNIFEVYHGHLGTQNTDEWRGMSDHVQKALADLNVFVHRCESVARGAMPRHVVTYYGLPKTETLTKDDYSLFEPLTEWGTVYLNYVEIGKTLEDLTLDNDQYIGDDEDFKIMEGTTFKIAEIIEAVDIARTPEDINAYLMKHLSGLPKYIHHWMQFRLSLYKVYSY